MGWAGRFVPGKKKNTVGFEHDASQAFYVSCQITDLADYAEACGMLVGCALAALDDGREGVVSWEIKPTTRVEGGRYLAVYISIAPTACIKGGRMRVQLAVCGTPRGLHQVSMHDRARWGAAS
jgi:hypothetical protein